MINYDGYRCPGNNVEEPDNYCLLSVSFQDLS